MIGERWGGSALIRAAVEREIAFLIDDFAHELTRIESMQHIHDSEDLKVLANILMDASFNWAMRWIGLSRDVAPEKLQQQQAAFKLQTIVQIQLSGVPAVTVNGKYIVQGEDAKVTQVVDYLIEKERAAK